MKLIIEVLGASGVSANDFNTPQTCAHGEHLSRTCKLLRCSLPQFLYVMQEPAVDVVSEQVLGQKTRLSS